MPKETMKFIRLMNHPVKFRLFLLYRLPSAFFSGLKIDRLSADQCVATIPYKWFSQNPFKSTYFACLAMAAEMSTGALAMAHCYKSNPAISMLVIKMESSFLKKATGITFFQCEDGAAFQHAIETAIASGQAQTLTAKSVGTNRAGERIAEFLITWSFKAKK